MLSEISAHTKRILLGAHPAALFNAIQDKVGPINGITNGTNIAGGNAISTFDAAQCLTDSKRTRAILSSLLKGIDHIKEGKEGPVEILEAGSGPTPLSLLAASLRPDDVKIVARDIHASSIEYAKKLAHALGLSLKSDLQTSNFFEDPLVGCEPDIILMEIMNTGLLDEPQGEGEVQMASRFPSTRIIRIPHEIVVTARALTYAWSNVGALLGELAVINDTFRENARKNPTPRDLLRVNKDFVLPPGAHYGIALETSVDMGFGHVVRPDHSSITKTLIYRGMCASPGDIIRIEYTLGGGEVNIKKVGDQNDIYSIL